MFGSKSKQKRQLANSPVADFNDPAIKWALRGNWLTLALSKFEVPIFSQNVLTYVDEPKAYGVVHFEHGDRLLRCELTLSSEPSEEYDRLGQASFERITDEDNSYVLLRVVLTDPRKKMERALQGAFDSAGGSGNRFVHVAFRREPPDIDAFLPELKEKNYGGYHPLTDISFKRLTILPSAPAWSWRWSQET